MARHNTLSRRLYRVLLRSCGRGVASANRGNSIASFGGIENDEGGDGDGPSDQLILLQPPMDQRKYGFARVAAARRGYEGMEAMSSFPGDGGGYNVAADKMSAEEVGMAMEVLRFVHVSLKGDPDDDLVDYYLGSGFDDVDGKGCSMVEVLNENFGAAAGRHSEGHYTQFLDKDEERGEGGDGDESPASSDHNDVGDDDDNDQENQFLKLLGQR